MVDIRARWLAPEHDTTHSLYTLPVSVSISCSEFMPRRRAAESVPEVEDGIEEVIIRHSKTKRGTRTTEKVVPVLIPGKEKPGQSSHSKKGKKPQMDPDNAEGSQVALPTIVDTQIHQFIDEPAEDLPDLEMEKDQPQATVCTRYYLHEVKSLIGCRL
jgi:hypothetical protein